jgi:hypothetical protein
MFTELLERLAHAFDEARLPYMIIGGQAVLLYGEPRLTRDIDITLGVDIDRQSDVTAVAAGPVLPYLVDPESFTKQTLVLPCLDPATGSGSILFFHSPPMSVRPSNGPLWSQSVTRKSDLRPPKTSSCIKCWQAAHATMKM